MNRKKEKKKDCKRRKGKKIEFMNRKNGLFVEVEKKRKKLQRDWHKRRK